MLFLIGLSLVGSGFARTRIEIGPLQIHPYFMIVVLILPLQAISRLSQVPTRWVSSLILFGGLYYITTFQGLSGAALAEGIKVGGSIATILTMTLLVSSWSDFVAGATGMAIAVAVLAVVGLGAGEVEGGVKAIESANRNAYSLYALPPILLCGYILVRGKSEQLLVKVVMAASVLASMLAIVMNVNRSGWLGLVFIILMLVYQKSIKSALIVAVVGVAGYFVMTQLFTVTHLQNRIHETQAGLESDKHRWELFEGSLIAGLEHPLLGVSPQELGYHLGNYLDAPGYAVYPHNIFAHIFGGSGVICFILMINIGTVLWRWNIPKTLLPSQQYALKEARTISRMLLLLWFVRGNFTHEIIYSPSFNMAIGLCAGLCILYSERSSRVPRRSESKLSTRR